MDDFLTPSELIKLGSRFGISIDKNEIQDLCNDIKINIDKLGDPYLTPSHTPLEVKNRSWWVPENNPYNSISVSCMVPPDRPGILSGLTVGIKDAISVAGIPMRAGSEIFSDFIPQNDATIVKRLLGSGATITSKTTLDELAASPRATTSVDGPILNPHDPLRVAGGSSGGSAISVSIGSTDIAIGTDTGGSVRGPASFCGVLGFKPTYGLIPLNGVVENTYTLDHVGIFTRDVLTMAKALESISGKDESDPSSMQAAGKNNYISEGYIEALQTKLDPANTTIGILEQGFGKGVDEEIEIKTRKTIDDLSAEGATIKTISMPNMDEHKALKDYISYTETAVHWRARGAPYRKGGTIDTEYQTTFVDRAQEKQFKLGHYYKVKLLTGCYLIEKDNGQKYTHSQAARSHFTNEFKTLMKTVDVLVTPTMAGHPPLVENASEPGFDTGRNTRIANLTGLPSISIPNGTINMLPIGLQLIGKEFCESELLRYTAMVQNLTYN